MRSRRQPEPSDTSARCPTCRVLAGELLEPELEPAESWCAEHDDHDLLTAELLAYVARSGDLG